MCKVMVTIIDPRGEKQHVWVTLDSPSDIFTIRLDGLQTTHVTHWTAAGSAGPTPVHDVGA